MKALIKLLSFSLGLILIGNILLPKQFFHPILNRQPAINTRFQAKIDEQASGIVLLGNSILKKGVDAMWLENKLERAVTDISVNGSTTPIWYLLLKNNIASSQQRPITVFIFFKDERLTTVGSLNTPLLQEHIQKFGGAVESLFDAIAYDLNWFDRLALTHISPYAYQDDLKDILEKSFKYVFPLAYFDVDRETIDNSVERVFSNANMNSDLLNQKLAASSIYGNIDSEGRFQEKLGQSFLPHMIELARANNIELVFVRMKSKNNLPGPDPEKRQQYFQQLGDYLSSEKITLWDYSNEPALQEIHFEDNDHLNPLGEALFTDILARDMLNYLSEDNR